MRDELTTALGRADVVVTPTTPSAAFRLGEKLADPLAMYLSDIFTTPASLVGLPAVAVPSGFDGQGLPLSLQIMGRPVEEATVFRAARAFQRQVGRAGAPRLPRAAGGAGRWSGADGQMGVGALPGRGEGLAGFAQRLCGDARLAPQLLESNRLPPNSRLKTGRRYRVTFEILASSWQLAAARALFPEDRGDATGSPPQARGGGARRPGSPWARPRRCAAR